MEGRRVSALMRYFIVLMLSDQKSEADRVGGEVVIQAQTSPSCTVTRQCQKRKIDQVDSDGSKSDKENVSLTRLAPTAKRIRREETGTEWGTVLDVIKFGEEQRRKHDEANGNHSILTDTI